MSKPTFIRLNLRGLTETPPWLLIKPRFSFFMELSLSGVILLGLILTMLATPLLAQANGETHLYLQNVPVQDEKLLVVNVFLSNVTDLYGADIQLSYDPTQMKVRDENSRLAGVQITPGPLLASDNRFVATNQADLEAGLIDFVFTLLKPAEPISGQGVLATIAFEISGNGPYSVAVAKAHLVSSTLEAIPVTAEDLYLNGALQPISQPQYIIASGSTWPWWRIAAFSSLLLALGLLVLLRSKRVMATLSRNANHTLPHRLAGVPHSTHRSALLLAEQGYSALRQDETRRAYELFNQAIELDPANANAWLGKGLAARQRIEKLICFQRALALDPDNREAQIELKRLDLPPQSKN